MERYTNFVIRHRRPVVIIFLLLAAIGAFLSTGVGTNYNMTDYLPEAAQSTTALSVMDEAFSQSVPNANVMVRNVDIPNALQIKQTLLDLPGVTQVLWLDDMADPMIPAEMSGQSLTSAYYKDGNALYSVTVGKGVEIETIAAIREIIGPDGAISGDAVDTSSMQEAASSEVLGATLILVPIVIIILALSTSSWLEPLLFLAAIGVSILINMGTNIFTGDISFITNSVSPILQLAVSLDYAIFLLHSFEAFRKEGNDAEQAMRLAMRKSVEAVAASAITTLFGFLALMFMDFGIGADLGFNLAKGIVFSFISCMIFLPALTISCIKGVDKLAHKPILPSFKGIGRPLSRIGIPVLVVVLIIAIPSFLGSQQVDFSYANVVDDPSSQLLQDKAAIDEIFSADTQMVLLVPRDTGAEALLSEELKTLPHVTSVTDYTGTVSAAIPPQLLSDSITSQFYSDDWARLIITLDTESEGEEAFAAVERISDTARAYFGDHFYTAGQSANLYDMAEIIAVDNTRVNLIAIIAIFLVLLVTFRSGVLPFILLFTIEVGIWINLSIPYFTGQQINFVGYLVLSTVQLGATVDYAILLTTYYMDYRKQMPQKQAIRAALGDAFGSILISALTLSVAGFTLMVTSSLPIVAEIGLLLCRGTILSAVMVVCMLPALLRLLDKPIRATTYKANFYIEDKSSKGESK